MNRKTLLNIAAGLVVGIGLGLGILFGINPMLRSEPDGFQGPMRGNTAPEFELVDANGDSHKLSDYAGQPVVLNFWATWCAPCRVEMPFLQNIYEQAEGDVAILAINFDEDGDLVKAFGDELNLTFPLLLDPDGEIQDEYLVFNYPTTLFLDGAGVIQFVHIGILSEGQLADYLNQLGVDVQ